MPSTDSTNQPGATAGVLLKALEIGATPLQISWLQFLPYCNPHEDGFGVTVNFTNHACMDLGMVVNKKTGKRFMDEHAGRKIKSELPDRHLRRRYRSRDQPVLREGSARREDRLCRSDAA